MGWYSIALKNMGGMSKLKWSGKTRINDEGQMEEWVDEETPNTQPIQPQPIITPAAASSEETRTFPSEKIQEIPEKYRNDVLLSGSPLLVPPSEVAVAEKIKKSVGKDYKVKLPVDVKMLADMFEKAGLGRDYVSKVGIGGDNTTLILEPDEYKTMLQALFATGVPTKEELGPRPEMSPYIGKIRYYRDFMRGLGEEEALKYADQLQEYEDAITGKNRETPEKRSFDSRHSITPGVTNRVTTYEGDISGVMGEAKKSYEDKLRKVNEYMVGVGLGNSPAHKSAVEQLQTEQNEVEKKIQEDAQKFPTFTQGSEAEKAQRIKNIESVVFQNRSPILKRVLGSPQSKSIMTDARFNNLWGEGSSDTDFNLMGESSLSQLYGRGYKGLSRV